MVMYLCFWSVWYWPAMNTTMFMRLIDTHPYRKPRQNPRVKSDRMYYATYVKKQFDVVVIHLTAWNISCFTKTWLPRMPVIFPLSLQRSSLLMWSLLF